MPKSLFLMLLQKISYQKISYFSSLICEYLKEKKTIKPFYNRFPKLENFEQQIQEKASFFSTNTRVVLSKTIQKQYANTPTSIATQKNLKLLQQHNTFTITTGHQLNLFTGPLYFLYKIITTINLCEELRKKYPKQNFVPIYWMATEDHDFLEINYFNFKEKKIEWQRNNNGAVGEFTTTGLQKVFTEFSLKLGLGKNAEMLKNLFKNAYINHTNLADATRYLANELFGEYGLVSIDANNKELKQLFVPYVKQELLQQTTHQKVSETIANFPYKIQVNPRKINLFYIKKELRERIIFDKGKYHVNNTNISWTKKEILQHLTEKPERFSPNVLLRPLLQEIILPNLCYIGGGGELAYWMELKSTFKTFKVPFPMLLLRNSALIITKKQHDKLKKINLNISDLFLSKSDLETKKIKELSVLTINFSTQKEALKKQFKNLYAIAKKTDKSFLGAVAAQEKKQLNGLDTLEKRLLKAEKNKNRAILKQITNLQNELFPKQNLQERKINFSTLYLMYGKNLIPSIKENLNPLLGKFSLLIEK